MNIPISSMFSNNTFCKVWENERKFGSPIGQGERTWLEEIHQRTQYLLRKEGQNSCKNYRMGIKDLSPTDLSFGGKLTPKISVYQCHHNRSFPASELGGLSRQHVRPMIENYLKLSICSVYGLFSKDYQKGTSTPAGTKILKGCQEVPLRYQPDDIEIIIIGISYWTFCKGFNGPK